MSRNSSWWFLFLLGNSESAETEAENAKTATPNTPTSFIVSVALGQTTIINAFGTSTPLLYIQCQRKVLLSVDFLLLSSTAFIYMYKRALRDSVSDVLLFALENAPQLNQ